MDCILPEYRLSADSYKELWENCIFVLDTSVLFNIYRYSPGLREEVIDVLGKISPRLWIPYQVAYEYYDNISSVISTEISKYDSIMSIVSSNQKLVIGEIDNNLRRKHTSSSEILIDLDKNVKQLESELDKSFKKIREDIKKKISGYPKKEDFEGIDETINSLLDSKVGKPYSITELEKISDKGANRYDLLLPPGYKDKKDKIGIKLYGDLIIWFQIIDMATEKKVPVIFICDDLKEGWWWRPSGKPLGPRPELVKEFASETKELFWMYSLDRFLEYAPKYIDVEVNVKSIDEAKEYRVDEEKRVIFEDQLDKIGLFAAALDQSKWASAAACLDQFKTAGVVAALDQFNKANMVSGSGEKSESKPELSVTSNGSKPSKISRNEKGLKKTKEKKR